MDYIAPLQSADSYNGASHDNFTWSQSISDLDVLVNIPDSLMSTGDLKVQISDVEIKVDIRKNLLQQSLLPLQQQSTATDVDSTANDDSKEWSILFKGQLTFPTKLRESLWTLLPGKYVHIHLEKVSERWWESLMVGEAKIQLDKVDCSKDYDNLSEEEQMKLQELMWEQHEKFSKSFN